jgi:hypothetical protein
MFGIDLNFGIDQSCAFCFFPEGEHRSLPDRGAWAMGFYGCLLFLMGRYLTNLTGLIL